jgi:glycosyltransferase involved in cell wall biosynthesis
MALAGVAIQAESPFAAPDRPLRVAQVVTKFTAGAGGITLRGALGLDPERFAVTILAAGGGSFGPRATAAGMELISLRHMAPDLNPWTDARGLRELTAQLAAGSFDLVHTHSAKAGALGRMAARRAGVPAVVHSIHGFPFHEFQSPLRRRSYLAIERRLARTTDYFLTDGTFVAAEAVRLKIAPPDRIRAIASPIDEGIAVASHANRRRARHLLGLAPGAKVVGTAARLDPQKSPLDMVRAIAGLGRSDVQLVWIGDGELRPKTERLIRRLGIAHRCLLLGEREDVTSLLPAFDVFALSSLYEGLPCAAVEAIACGVPVVATAVNSVPEIVVPGRTGLLVRPGDPASLGRALSYLLDHPAEGARMAQAARAHIGDRFAARVLGEDLTQAYEAALAVAADRGALCAGLRGDP